jgi:hypothetical protein
MVATAVFSCYCILLAWTRSKLYILLCSNVHLWYCSAFYIPTCIKLISLWFDTSEIALANGMLTSASPAGQLVANLFGYNIAMAIGGWRMLWMVLGVAALVPCCIYFLCS